MSILYEIREAINETPAPANKACGTVRPSKCKGIEVVGTEKNLTLAKLSAAHLIPDESNLCFKLLYAGKNSSL